VAVIKFEGDASGVLRAVSDIERALGRINKVSQSATQGLDGINQSARRISDSLGVIRVDSLINLAERAAGATVALARVADSATNLRNRMGTVAQSNEQAAAAFSRVIAMSNKTGISADALGENLQKITLTIRPMGYGLEQAAQLTETLGNALRITGTAGPAAASAMYQITQALGRGTVVFEDLKQLQESAAPVLALIAEQFGMSSQQFLAAVQAGQVGSRDLVRAFQNMREGIDKEVQALKPTFAMATNELRNNFMVALDEMEGRYGVFTKLGEAVKLVGQNLDVALPMLAAFMGYFAAARIAATVVELMKAVAAMRALGIASAVTSSLATGGLAALTGIAGATAAYLAASAVFDNMDKNAANAGKNLDDVAGKITKVQKATQALKLEGPVIDVKQLESASKRFLEQYEIVDDMVGLGSERLAQEQAVLQFAKQQNITYEQINSQAGEIADKIRKAVRDSQVAGAANRLMAGQPQGLSDTRSIDLEAVDKSLATGRVSEQQAADMKLAINQQYQANLLALEQKTAEQRLRANGVVNQQIIDAVTQQMANVRMMQQGGIAGAQGVLSSMMGVFGAMAGQNKKAFEMHKKMAVAQALISTYQAAAMSIAAPPGPPFSYIYVAAAIAAGLAQVAAISSQQYSGRALGGPVMGNTPYLVGENGPEMFMPNNAGRIQRNDQLGGSPTNVNFTIVANDAVGFDNLLNTRKVMIKQMISDAMLDKGQRF
jgi:tape measure domain-containing protein